MSVKGSAGIALLLANEDECGGAMMGGTELMGEFEAEVKEAASVKANARQARRIHFRITCTSLHE